MAPTSGHVGIFLALENTLMLTLSWKPSFWASKTDFGSILNGFLFDFWRFFGYFWCIFVDFFNAEIERNDFFCNTFLFRLLSMLFCSCSWFPKSKQEWGYKAQNVVSLNVSDIGSCSWGLRKNHAWFVCVDVVTDVMSFSFEETASTCLCTQQSQKQTCITFLRYMSICQLACVCTRALLSAEILA